MIIAFPMAPAAEGAGPTPLACDTASVQAALATGGSYEFDCSGTIDVPGTGGGEGGTGQPAGPFVVDGVSVMLAAAPNQTVSFEGHRAARVLLVENGGHLDLEGVTVADGYLEGTRGADGANGAYIPIGSAAPAGSDGTNGVAGNPGSPATSGRGADGAGVFIDPSSSARLVDDVFKGNSVVGGRGGQGGGGGNGQNGTGGGLTRNPATGPPPAPTNGGNGGPGGDGASGGAGGDARGGGIYNQGTLNVSNSEFDANSATGGIGGRGGPGGGGGNGASGGGPDGSNGNQDGHLEGRGGDGGDASTQNGGPGAGGNAAGGAIYNDGTLTLGSVSFSADTATGGAGGAPEQGGAGGAGGAGGGFGGGGNGGNGGPGVGGGTGGDATGGAVYTTSAAAAGDLRFASDKVTLGAGGQCIPACSTYGGAAGAGGPGVGGGPGGAPGTAGAGAINGGAGHARAPDFYPPELLSTNIDGGPAGTVDERAPTFSFHRLSDDRFECWVDSGPPAADSGSPVPCTSPWTSPMLAEGPHTFYVRALGTDGSVEDPPAERSFVVLPDVPAVSDGSAPPALDGFTLGAPVPAQPSPLPLFVARADSAAVLEGLLVDGPGGLLAGGGLDVTVDGGGQVDVSVSSAPGGTASDLAAAGWGARAVLVARGSGSAAAGRRLRLQVRLTLAGRSLLRARGVVRVLVTVTVRVPGGGGGAGVSRAGALLRRRLLAVADPPAAVRAGGRLLVGFSVAQGGAGGIARVYLLPGSRPGRAAHALARVRLRARGLVVAWRVVRVGRGSVGTRQLVVCVGRLCAAASRPTVIVGGRAAGRAGAVVRPAADDVSNVPAGLAKSYASSLDERLDTALSEPYFIANPTIDRVGYMEATEVAASAWLSDAQRIGDPPELADMSASVSERLNRLVNSLFPVAEQACLSHPALLTALRFVRVAHALEGSGVFTEHQIESGLKRCVRFRLTLRESFNETAPAAAQPRGYTAVTDASIQGAPFSYERANASHLLADATRVGTPDCTAGELHNDVATILSLGVNRDSIAASSPAQDLNLTLRFSPADPRADWLCGTHQSPSGTSSVGALFQACFSAYATPKYPEPGYYDLPLSGRAGGATAVATYQLKCRTDPDRQGKNYTLTTNTTLTITHNPG